MPEHSLHDERELLLKIAAGDEKAFNLIFDKYRLPVYAHVLSITKSPERAEEITQDVFIKVWNKRTDLSSVVSFADWLFIITRNYSISELRKALIGKTAPAGENVASTDDPVAGLIYKETNQLLQTAIRQLPTRRRQIFILSRIEQKSHKEIAKEMGITPGTVNLQLVQALLFIRNFLHSSHEKNKNLPGEYIFLVVAASLMT